MNLTTIIVVILIIFLLGGLPQAGWHDRGYGISGVVGLILVVVLILALLGKI